MTLGGSDPLKPSAGKCTRVPGTVVKVSEIELALEMYGDVVLAALQVASETTPSLRGGNSGRASLAKLRRDLLDERVHLRGRWAQRQ